MRIVTKSHGATLGFEYPLEDMFDHLPKEKQVIMLAIIKENLRNVLKDLTVLLAGTMRSDSLSIAILVILAKKIQETAIDLKNFDEAVLAGKNPLDVYAEYNGILPIDPFMDFIDTLDLGDLD